MAHGAEGGLKKRWKDVAVFILFFFLLEEQAKAYREEEKEAGLSIFYSKIIY